MILRTLHVSGWRCFPDPVEVGPFTDGLNVIFAPNAFGKSTLFESLHWALFDSHRVMGTKAESLRPWGRVLAPEVTVEFSHGGQEFRLAKRFLDKPSSELQRKEGGKYTRLAEGDAADERVREILLGKPSGRGPTSTAHRGVCQVLWAPQGEMELNSLSDDLVTNIQQSLGAQVSGSAKVGRLEAGINQLFDRYFTSQGKLKSGKGAPPVVALRSELDKAAETRQKLTDAVLAFEDASRRVEDLRAARLQAKRNAAALAEELDKAREESKDYTALVSEKNERLQKVEATKAMHSELKQRVDAIAVAKKERSEAREGLTLLETNVPMQIEEVGRREAAVSVSKAALEEARLGREKVEGAESESKRAQQYLDASQKLTDTGKLLGDIRRVEKSRQELGYERNRLVAPDAKALKAVQKAIKQQDEAQVRLDAALITLEVVPEKKLFLKAVAAENLGEEEFEAGATARFRGAPEVVVDLEGIARIRARGPSGTVEELRGQVSKATEKIERLTLEYGTTDPQKLEELSERAAELDRQISEQQTVLETLLAGRTSEELEQEKSRAAKLAGELLAGNEDWREKPPDADGLEAAARKTKTEFIALVEQAESKWEVAQNALRAAGDKKAALQAEYKATGRLVESLSVKSKELEDDGMDDKKRADDLKKLALAWEAAQAGLDKVSEELEKLGEDPAKVIEKLLASLAAAEKQSTEALGKEKAEEGRLQQLASEGNYSKVALAEEAHESLTREIERDELRANAVKLLHETVDGCRRRAIAEVAKPVEDIASSLFRRIAGSRLGDLAVSECFSPKSVAPGVASGTDVSVGELSVGEQEQVHFAVRLALAQVISKDEKQLVVLDDALTATDTGRLARILSIIEDSLAQLQVLILTCHPEKYGGLTGAEFFDLEKIAARA